VWLVQEPESCRRESEDGDALTSKFAAAIGSAATCLPNRRFRPNFRKSSLPPKLQLGTFGSACESITIPWRSSPWAAQSTLSLVTACRSSRCIGPSITVRQLCSPRTAPFSSMASYTTTTMPPPCSSGRIANFSCRREERVMRGLRDLMRRISPYAEQIRRRGPQRENGRSLERRPAGAKGHPAFPRQR